MPIRACRLIAPTLALWIAASGVQAHEPAKLQAAILVDHGTGEVLREENADVPVPPASTTKLMTAEVVFHLLSRGALRLGDRFEVSEKAWREGGAPSGGSTSFLPVADRVSVYDLLQGLIVQSGNDAAIVLAEGIAGSTEAFADLMNRRAREIGLRDSRFTNPHGLPDPQQRVTVRDLARLARHVIAEHKDFYHLFGQPRFTYNGIEQRNRNPLLDEGIGADGLKTGYTSRAGYNLVASAVHGGRRLVLATAGAPTARARARDSERLLRWGFCRTGAPIDPADCATNTGAAGHQGTPPG